MIVTNDATAMFVVSEPPPSSLIENRVTNRAACGSSLVLMQLRPSTSASAAAAVYPPGLVIVIVAVLPEVSRRRRNRLSRLIRRSAASVRYSVHQRQNFVTAVASELTVTTLVSIRTPTFDRIDARPRNTVTAPPFW